MRRGKHCQARRSVWVAGVATLTLCLALFSAPVAFGGTTLGADRAASEKPVVRPIAPLPQRLTAFPRSVTLLSRGQSQQLLITGWFGPDDEQDLTRSVRYHSSDRTVASISPQGAVSAVGDGKAVITAVLSASPGAKRVAASLPGSVQVPVTIRGSTREQPVSFEHDVEPVLSRFGCNAGGCHGKATGQNGFRLSLFGFDPPFDYDALVKDGRGRRLAPTRPEESLLLVKATGAVPHGGGRRIEPGSLPYALLRRWVAQGMPFTQKRRPTITRLSVTPSERLMGRGESQQVAVTAHYSDGSARDVTREALFRSNEEALATVDEQGLVTTGKQPGEAAIMASFMGQVAVFRAAVPLGAPPNAFGLFLSSNYVDDLVSKKLRKLGIPPSDLCTDAEFIRRASVDLCGRLPAPQEVRAFVTDRDPDKRRKLVDRLLEDPDYASLFALKWSNLLRNSGDWKGSAYAFHDWIRGAFAANMPYDRFVREIVTSQGEWETNPPSSWFWHFRDGGAEELTEDVAQLFLGTRIQCAHCHHHPYEKWSQNDYYGLVGFFTRLGRKDTAQPGYSYVARRVVSGVRNPRTGKQPEPKPLDGPVLTVKPGEDPRRKLADWMAAPRNPFFAPTIANRLWAHLMGRGLVEPVDDMRVTNPPSNPELLSALSRDLIQHRFDLKHLIRTITSSRTYQLSSIPNRHNGADRQNYARRYARRLTAEVLLDAVDQMTGVKTSFKYVSPRARALDLPHEGFPSYFLEVFGRPRQLTSPCECARDFGANLSQVLHLANAGALDKKLADDAGRAAALAKSSRPVLDRITELYLCAFARPPDARELRRATDFVNREKDPRKAFEELIWTFLNCREFQFNH